MKPTNKKRLPNKDSEVKQEFKDMPNFNSFVEEIKAQRAIIARNNIEERQRKK